MVIEAGAEYSVSQLVKDCGKNDCATTLDRKETGFDYSTSTSKLMHVKQKKAMLFASGPLKHCGADIVFTNLPLADQPVSCGVDKCANSCNGQVCHVYLIGVAFKRCRAI